MTATARAVRPDVPTTTAPPARNVSTAQGIWLVAEREITSKVRSKSFLISTAILLVMALAGIIATSIIAARDEATPIATDAAVASQLASATGGGDAFDVTQVGDRAAAEDLVASGDVDAAVIADASSPTGVTVIAEDEAPADVLAALTVSPTVELLNPDGESQMRYLLGLIFGLVFMMAGISFGSPITQSVVEEKQTRVVEILLSSISPRVLLAGKVIGNTALAMGQVVALIAVVVIGLTVTGQTEFLEALGAPMAWFALFFLVGFVLLAAMFAVAGALVSRQEDTGATMSPVIYLLMIPYVLVIVLGGNDLAMTIMAYVPFSAPVALPIRLYFGDAPWFEPLISLVILVATCVGAIVLGAKIYENSLLKMGARVKLKDALRA